MPQLDSRLEEVFPIHLPGAGAAGAAAGAAGAAAGAAGCSGAPKEGTNAFAVKLGFHSDALGFNDIEGKES